MQIKARLYVVIDLPIQKNPPVICRMTVCILNVNMLSLRLQEVSLCMHHLYIQHIPACIPDLDLIIYATHL